LTADTAAPVGSLATALAHAVRLLETRPALAAEQARAILEAVPGQPDAIRLLARALWANDDLPGAVATLRRRTETEPRDAAAWRLLADALMALGPAPRAYSAASGQSAGPSGLLGAS